MKKFGLGKKDKAAPAAPADQEEEQSRSRLFGSKSSKASKTHSPAPASSNPYAAQSSNPDPYAKAQTRPDPYARSDTGSTYAASSIANYPASIAPSTLSQPPSYEKSSSKGGGYGGYGGYGPPPGVSERARNAKSPVPAGGYGGAGGAPGTRSQGYGGAGSYADSGRRGYGSDRFGTGADQQLAPPGRVGALGRTRSQDTMSTEAGKEALFGGARDRYEQQHIGQDLPDGERDSSAAGEGAGGVDGGYGAYQERQLTAEEMEEEDVQATKDQIRELKQQDVASTRNALRIAAQAEETGRATLERLGAQGERIHNTEKNLDLAANQNRLAEEKARELKHLNRSMFAVKIDNPFTKSRRERDYEDKILTTHQSERQQRDATRAAAYESSARQREHDRELKGPTGVTVKKGNLAERSKYQFEADSEDEAMEDEIDSNLDALSGAAGRLNALGRAMGKEVDNQNKHIDRIVGKADCVDDQINLNRARLDRIK